MAISNTVATIPGITVPVIVEYVLDGVEVCNSSFQIVRSLTLFHLLFST